MEDNLRDGEVWVDGKKALVHGRPVHGSYHTGSISVLSENAEIIDENTRYLLSIPNLNKEYRNTDKNVEKMFQVQNEQKIIQTKMEKRCRVKHTGCTYKNENTIVYNHEDHL